MKIENSLFKLIQLSLLTIVLSACVPSGQSKNSATSTSTSTCTSTGTGTTISTSSQTSTHTSTVSSTATATQVTMSSDGSANAPIGTPQHTALLSGYPFRPSWKVAGVDYAVGVPSALILKDPATIKISGVTISGSVITVTADNVTLDGYDFSLKGGYNVTTQAANTRIVNSKFVIGANDQGPIVGTPTSSNLYIGYCILDGNDHNGTVWGGLVAARGTGLTIEYTWLKNAGGDMIQTIGGGGLFTVRYNVFENGGLLPGTHGDYIQIESSITAASIIYNTTIQSITGSTQGLMTEYIAQGEIGHNVMTGGVSYFTSVDLSSLTGTMTVDNNYFDLSQAYGFVYPNSGPGDSSPLSVFVNNVNMVTGAKIQD